METYIYPSWIKLRIHFNIGRTIDMVSNRLKALRYALFKPNDSTHYYLKAFFSMYFCWFASFVLIFAFKTLKSNPWHEEMRFHQHLQHYNTCPWKSGEEMFPLHIRTQNCTWYVLQNVCSMVTCQHRTGNSNVCFATNSGTKENS